MKEPTRQILTFEGHEGEILNPCGEVPSLIKLGDGSLWILEDTVFGADNSIQFLYIPAVVTEFSWVVPQHG